MRRLLARVVGTCIVLFVLSVCGASAQEEFPVLESRPSVDVTFMVMQNLVTPQTMSLRGVEVLKVFESFAPKAYRDGKGYSIGYGMQTWEGRRVTYRYPRSVTMEQAHAEFLRQLPIYENIVRELVLIDVPQEVFDAFVSIAWNLGRVNDAILAKLDRQAVITVKDFLSTARYRGRIDWRLQGRRTREFLMALGEYEAAMAPVVSPKEVRVTTLLLARRPVNVFVDEDR